MVIRTTKHPTCSNEQVGGAVKPPSVFKKVLRVAVQAIKHGLSYALKRPGTWRFLMVHVPDFFDMAWHLLKSIALFFTNL